MAQMSPVKKSRTRSAIKINLAEKLLACVNLTKEFPFVNKMLPFYINEV